jgi:hypothetical protein
MNDEFGPTHDFPEGKLDESDEGGLNIAISHDDKGNVRLDFGTPTAWIALGHVAARALAGLIMEHAVAAKGLKR